MRKIALFFVCLSALSASAQHHSKGHHHAEAVDSLEEHARQYADSLQKMVDEHQRSEALAQSTPRTVTMNPYYYPLISGGTIYSTPVQQSLGIQWAPKALQTGGWSLAGSDRQLVATEHINEQLVRMYTLYPQLFTQTQETLMKEGVLVADVKAPMTSETRMSEQIQLADIDHEVTDTVAAIARKPNFWKFKGSNSLQLTQNYATDNWFQGKANYYNVLGIVAVEANFDNKRRIQWDNRLDLQLGFQTNDNEGEKKFKPTNNLFRLNSKLGIKAAHNWYYTVNLKAETQLVPNYQYEKKDGVVTGHNTITDFLSPLNVDLSVGIDWKWNLKRFTGSLYLAPGTYNVKYVDRLALATRYGLEEDHHFKHTFGPSATAKFNWKIRDNITWDGRLYWITNLSYTNIEFENTITFSITRYLTSKLYVYPRFNDSRLKNRMPDDEGNNTGTYWMFKEWLSLGVSYDW